MNKKMLSCLAIGGMALLAVGCGNDQLKERKVYGEGYEILKCDLPQDKDSESQASYLQVVRNFKENKIVETSLNLEFDYTETLKGDTSGVGKKTMHSGLDLMCDAFEKEGYMDCYYSAEGYIYTITMGMDIEKMAEGAIKNSATLEEIKTGLEGQNELEVKNCRIEKGTNN